QSRPDAGSGLRDRGRGDDPAECTVCLELVDLADHERPRADDGRVHGLPRGLHARLRVAVGQSADGPELGKPVRRPAQEHERRLAADEVPIRRLDERNPEPCSNTAEGLMAFGAVKLMPGVDVQKTFSDNQAGVSQSQAIRYKENLIQTIGGWVN